MTETLHNGAQRKLISFVDRIERLEEEKKALADDIASVYAEAKSDGFDVKAMRNVVKLRKMEDEDRVSFLAVMDSYQHALGMLADTELGQAAMRRAADEVRKRSSRKMGQPAGTA
jgi:uncharacterized protein (UPF0335 family)